MTGRARAQGRAANLPTQGSISFAERLSVPWWWWVVSLAATSLLAYEVHLGTPSIRIWLPFLITVPLTAWGMYSLGALRVSVTASAAGGELRVGQAHLPLSVVSRVTRVPASSRRSALGRQLDPAAFVQFRAWVPQMVALVLDDPHDPTPYWLVSTRHPGELIEALGTSRVARPS